MMNCFAAQLPLVQLVSEPSGDEVTATRAVPLSSGRGTLRSISRWPGSFRLGNLLAG